MCTVKTGAARYSESPLFRRFVNPKVVISEGSLFRRFVYPENEIRFDIPKVR